MGTKFKGEKFTSVNDFEVWKMKMKAVLVKEGWATALESEDKFQQGMRDEEKKDLLEKGL